MAPSSMPRSKSSSCSFFNSFWSRPDLLLWLKGTDRAVSILLAPGGGGASLGDFGNLGVSGDLIALAARLVDRRIASRTAHCLFFATRNRIADDTGDKPRR